MILKVSQILHRLWENNVVEISPELYKDGKLLIINDCGAELVDRDEQTESWHDEINKTFPK